MYSVSLTSLLMVFCLSPSSIQPPFADNYKSFGDMYILKLDSAPFPHPARADGHTYQGRKYSFEEHYNDNSVAVFVPSYFQKTADTNIVVYFHGWNNNIKGACDKYRLIKQFYESRKNAIFIFPEGPKNAPDSHGGRLEEKDAFKHLISDVLAYLVKIEKVPSSKVGNVILAGHSGAYRVISFCLVDGGLTPNISDVILFDALYGKTEKYVQWIKNYKGRFINIYTDDGGTREETENLMQNFDAWHIPYFKTVETELDQHELKQNRLIFIHSDLSHDEVVFARKQFQVFLTTSNLEPINKK